MTDRAEARDKEGTVMARDYLALLAALEAAEAERDKYRKALQRIATTRIATGDSHCEPAEDEWRPMDGASAQAIAASALGDTDG